MTTTPHCIRLPILLACSLLALTVAGEGFSQTIDSTTPRPVAQANELTVLPVIDGNVLDDPAWRAAEAITDFWQVQPGYGIPTQAMNDALMLLARLEGLLFDPVYSGKGLAGMIDLVGKGYFAGAENIIFVHTGGIAGLFGYANQLVTDN